MSDDARLNELGKQPTPAEFRANSPRSTNVRNSRRPPNYSSYYGSRLPQTRNGDTNHDSNHGGTPRVNYSFSRDSSRKLSADHEAFYQGDDTSLYEPSLPKPQQMSGFYIDQQRRVENSEAVKVNMYTHKTFRDVFQAEEENRLNPMEVVFDEPKLKTKKKISRAFKQVFGKNDYASYDYSQHDDVDQPESLEVRSEMGDLSYNDNDNVPVPANPEVTYGNSDFRRPSQKFDAETIRSVPSEMNQQSRKWWTGKGSRGGNSRADDKTFSEDEIQPVEENRHQVPMEGSSMPEMLEAGNMQPLWNYLLSWIAYSETEQDAHVIDGKITEIRDDVSDDLSSQFECLSTSLSTGNAQEHLQTSRDVNRSKGYRKLLKKLNKPASEYINERNSHRYKKELPQIANSRHGLSESGVLVPQSEGLGLQFPQETNNGEHEQVAESSASNEYFLSKHHDEPPRTIMSNVNKLIKNIRIMRIIFAPIDIVAENFPQIQTFVIFIELFIFMWILYELSLLIDALCMAIKAVCAPMIAVGKFMNRIV